MTTGIPAPAPRTARSGIAITEGWLGVQGRYGYEAHGEFESVPAARAYLRQHWHDYRRINSDVPGGVEAIEANPTLAVETP